MTAYGEIIKTWSDSPHFTLNLMFFNRPPIHPDIDNIIGNFSSTLLLEMNLSGSALFTEKAKNIQKQLMNDLEHNEFNGVKVLNEINRRKGGSNSATMPVVFACALNLKPIKTADMKLFKWYGNKVTYSHLETPQVWLDHQVFEDDDGSLCCIWDSRDAYFPIGLIENMFNSYKTLLQEISQEKLSIGSLTPTQDIEKIEAINNTFEPEINELLHTGIFEQAKQTPDKVALITQEISITYKELVATSYSLKQKLIEVKVKPNDFVGIIMEKGWEQVIAAIAVLNAGAVYIPIDVSLPEERIRQIINNSNCKAIFLQQQLKFELNLPKILVTTIENKDIDNLHLIQSQKPDDLAYIIFTSGSTGIPKGVMISHKAALNTIANINKKYKVTTKDKVFAISSFSFDLSVYDIFGLLNAGGQLYIPTKSEIKTPEKWVEIIENFNITIWNSAPALMQLFMEIVILKKPLNSNLRIVLLSGDWIPLWLPEQIKQYFYAQVISLGGATEASIWSNFYEIDKVDPSWVSIPYGKPLPNQNMYILDDNLDYRANFATGAIYIGGVGLAKGYLNDNEKTKNSFIFHSKMNKLLYYTGDLGRMCLDGNIEFLGRKDLQVKIQGYRIELGEIESAITLIPTIKQVIVRATGDKTQTKKIIAFFTAEKPLDVNYIKDSLATKLPAYMIPSHFSQVESFPLNINGKIDINQLINKINLLNKNINNYEAPSNAIEEKIATIWCKLLNVKKVGRNDNFFDIGGNSFVAFQMIHQIKKEFTHSISLTTVFQKGTIKAIAKDLSQIDIKVTTPLVILKQNGSKAPLFLIHPSGGGVLCYTDLVKEFDDDRPFYGLQHPSYLGNNINFSTLESLATNYLEVILDKCPDGNCWIGGWSFGGVVSFEIATKLKEKGITPKPLILIDSPSPIMHEIPNDKVLYDWFVEDYGAHYPLLEESEKVSLYKVFKNNITILTNYVPSISSIDIIQLKAQHITINQLKLHNYNQREDWGWSKFSSGKINNIIFDANHTSIIQYPNIKVLTQKLLQLIKENE